MRRNKIVEFCIWVIIGLALVFIFNIFPQTRVLPTGLLLLLAIAIIAYRAHRQSAQDQTIRIFGRQIKPTVAIAVAIGVLAFELIVLIGVYKFAGNNISQLILVTMIVQAMLVLAVVLIITSVRMIMRD
jgi:hypothetical protein